MNSALMDEAILKTFPLIAAPSSGSRACGSAGVQYIAAKNGLYQEISLPWVNVVHRVADAKLPYGAVSNEVRLHCSDVPKEMWKQFRRDAIAAMPNEFAAALIWDEVTDDWRYAAREVTYASPVKVTYREVSLEEGEHLVVDLHSHGDLHAFFSEEDDADDFGAMRFSGVMGNVAGDSPSFVFRLNMLERKWVASINASGSLEVML